MRFQPTAPTSPENASERCLRGRARHHISGREQPADQGARLINLGATIDRQATFAATALLRIAQRAKKSP